MDILELFAMHPFWAFMSLAAVLLAAELMTGTTYLLWFSVAAGITALLLSIIPDQSLAFDIILFAILSFVTVFAGIKFFPFTGKIHNNDINDPQARLLGEVVVTLEDFHSGIGAVKVGDTRWRALCADGNPKAGVMVKISKIDGATLFVEAIE